MVKREADVSDIEEQLAEAQAQIEALQAAAADAEARAATLGERVVRVESELASAESASESARVQLSEAAARYRAARLAAAPDVPQDLVPEAASLDEVDQGIESALRVVSRLRERMQEERTVSRVPAGSPARRAPDLSALSPAEKIRLGLRDLSEREGR